ncbi:ribonucleoside-diphosphate reductase large subunit-like [Argentina anserina]|uniref:ribonucleoside-diphosphate reductase large subunit-like n=1 Tax=Argentina anserina TaxID=57926 RepID=UPI0021767624|nr:ribonucleoside-diphosphate reductase large subunit-like [Potentilla anserina]
MLFKDTCNKKSNQQNLGTIKCSNLCTEVIEYTSPTETVVCNLASIALPRFVREKGVPFESHPSKLVGSKGSKNQYFDFEKLAEVTSIVTVNLNKIIDVNYYPVESVKTSNLRHRPIGIGVQGLADTFILLGMSFDSPEAQQLNKDIFETIYYHALKDRNLFELCGLVLVYDALVRVRDTDMGTVLQFLSQHKDEKCCPSNFKGSFWIFGVVEP